MSNGYFRFKQFTIHQDRCAMKVSTDGCIQGAVTPILPQVKNVLDIGCGTGLLSLMLAQRNEHIHIDAIELDPEAAEQANENVAASPWKDRIHVFQGDIRSFHSKRSYDLIICNPPFFNNSLLGEQAERNQARHTIHLTQQDLLRVVKELLSKDGYCSVMLPTEEHRLWEELAAKENMHHGFWASVKPNANARINRIITTWHREQQMSPHNMIVTIYQSDKSYTPLFAELLQPFYLNL